MRLSPARLAVPAIALVAGLAALALALAILATAAPAQAGMDCFGNRGGRATCVEGRDSIIDRLDVQARQRQAAAAHDKKLVWKIAEAVHQGRCSDALVLAVKAKDPAIAANTARLCGVPDGDYGRAPTS